MTHVDESESANEEALAGIDLQAWRVPTPATLDRAALIERALSPAVAATKRPRMAWILTAIVLVGAALTTLLVIGLARPSPAETARVVPTVGGAPVDAETRALRQQLREQNLELERVLAEVKRLKAEAVEMSQRMQALEKQAPKRKPRPVSRDAEATPALGSCDEVSCILTNHEGACCVKFRAPAKTDHPL